MDQVETFEFDCSRADAAGGRKGLVEGHAGDAHGGAGLGMREDLEGAFGEHTKASQAADHEFRQIESGRVLDHLGAAADDLAPAVDEGHREQEVPQAAVAQAAGTVGARSHGAADGAAGVDEQRVEGKVLAFRREPRLDIG